MNERQLEQDARTIDPQAWAYFDHGMTNPTWGDAPRQVSLHKAREIAARHDPGRQS